MHACMYCSCIRMEALHIRTMAGSLKVAGVLLSVGGTMIISLYKGEILHLWNPILHLRSEEHVGVARHQLRGTFLLAGSTFMFACWYLIQVMLPVTLSMFNFRVHLADKIFCFSDVRSPTVQGSQRVSIQVLVIHGDLLGWRVSDCTCRSYSEEGQGRLEDRMGHKPSDHCVLGN